MPGTLLYVVDRLNKTEWIPVAVPVTTVAYIYHLINECSAATHPLRQFLYLKTDVEAVFDALLATVLPAATREMLGKADEYEPLIEAAVSDGDFHFAWNLKSERDVLRKQIAQLKPVYVNPDDVINSLRLLGFNDELPR